MLQRTWTISQDAASAQQNFSEFLFEYLSELSVCGDLQSSLPAASRHRAALIALAQVPVCQGVSRHGAALIALTEVPVCQGVSRHSE